ncbi:hypothetical protein BC628DRAFT_1418603 [Trametes gibbosa]|nr:hypothetical protein BC628DRAFT_1418603 [Trametes gibbosa]
MDGHPSSIPPSRDDTEGYRAFFGKDKKPVPKWVPVALLAFSTAAMAVPVLMLRRHRAATLGKALAEAPPPPTRRSSSTGIPISSPNATFLPASQSSLPASAASRPPRAEDGFNGAWHCAKAFGIATLLVGAGATTTVWGVRRYMGVETVRAPTPPPPGGLRDAIQTLTPSPLKKTQEFADRTRAAVLSRMPSLSARIYRPAAPEDDGPSAAGGARTEASPGSIALSPSEVQEWTWPAAEQRLRDAFEKDGFSGWAAALLRELEAEGRLERTKRGHV